MQFEYFIGWDISKTKLDYSVGRGFKSIRSGEVPNQVDAIIELFDKLETDFGISALNSLHCAENTGRYTNRLSQAALIAGRQLWIEDPLSIKNATAGRCKDKTDTKDAARIGEYAARYQEQAVVYTPQSQLVEQLRTLNIQRQQLVRALQGMRTAFKEDQQFTQVPISDQAVLVVTQGHQLVKQQIEKIEALMKQLIKDDPEANRIYKIAQSTPGMGPKNTMTVMIITGLFKRITTSRACASYAGICPHEYQSGSSVKKRSQTSPASNKALKTAFHQGAIAVITKQGIYRSFYERLIERGKTHLQATNAVRNKMIRVLYACIKNDVMYDKKYHKNLLSL